MINNMKSAKKDNTLEIEEETISGSAINQYVAAILCSVLNLIYGLSIGWASMAVTQLKKGGKDLPSGENGVDELTLGWIGGAFCLGALIFSPIYGFLVDLLGRKYTAYMIAATYLIHWTFIAFARNMIYVYIARGIGGIGGAGSITVTTVYNNEIADDKNRGILNGFMVLFYTIGVLIAYIIGHYFTFYYVTYINLGLTISFILVWWKMPDSPKFLLLKSREKEALKAITWLKRCSLTHGMKMLNEIKLQQNDIIKTATIKEFFQNNVARRGLIIVTILSLLQSFSGMFAISSYANTVFSNASGKFDPFLGTVIYGIAMCVGVIISQFTVEKFGRKVLLCLSSSLLAIGMAVSGSYSLASSLMIIKSDDDNIIILLILTLSGCALAYSMGLGSVIYVTMTELFSDDTRGLACSFFSIVTWSSCFVTLQYFGASVEFFGDYVVFYFFSAICCLGTVFIYFFVPETKGKPFRDISEELLY